MSAALWRMSPAEMSQYIAANRNLPVPPLAAPPPPPRKIARPRLTFRNYDDFMPAFRAAREAAIAAAGVRWWMSPETSIWARVPPAWVYWRGLSRSGTSPRDLHFPMGQFWPGGHLPYGPEYAAPVSVAQFANPAPRRRITLELKANAV
jgi:hypothetical protein